MQFSMSATVRAVKEVMGAKGEAVRQVHGVLCGLLGAPDRLREPLNYG